MTREHSLAEVKIKHRQPAYQQIADALRGQILSGELKPRTRLPSTEELAKLWQSSYFTVHTALSALAKEGLVERRHGSGTCVADPRSRFTCAGLYYGENVWQEEESAVYRNIHTALQARFDRLKKQTRVFIDSRPKTQQHELLPSLAEAIKNHEIQCLIAPVVNASDLPALIKLTIPTAFFQGVSVPNRVQIDEQSFLEQGLQRLVAQGCRSVGLISSLCPTGLDKCKAPAFYENFDRLTRSKGVETRDAWVRKPYRPPQSFGAYGYREFRKLWSQAERPEGLIACYDTVERGVITAMLEVGVRVPEQLKVFFHRNANVALLCPFPASWGVVREELVADAFIQLIDQQFNGEETSPIEVPLVFEETTEIVGLADLEASDMADEAEAGADGSGSAEN